MNTLLFVLLVPIGILIYVLVRYIILIRFRSRLKSPKFKNLYRESILQVVDVFEELNLIYWFTEGTLIGLLRYGANDHPSRSLSIDEDIDVMVETIDHQEWTQVKKKLLDALTKKGWGNYYERTTSSSKKGRIDKMQMWFQKGKKIHTHVDIHNYLRDDKKEVATSHKEKNSYPFQYWNDELPLRMIHPMIKCKCYGRNVPCPAKPIEILQGWNGGEYKDSNIAYPPGIVSEEEKETIFKESKKLSMEGYASMIEEIEKIT